MRPRALLLLLAGLAALAGTAHAVAGHTDDGPPGSAARQHTGHHSLRVSASVGGPLYPGAQALVLVRVKSLRHRPLVIRRSRVWVDRAPRGCSARSLSFSVFRGQVPLPPGGVRLLALTARMAPQAENACQGAGYQLGVRARAAPRSPR